MEPPPAAPVQPARNRTRALPESAAETSARVDKIWRSSARRFNTNLIDPIFIALKREATITDKAEAFNRINQQVGAEAFKWMGLGICIALIFKNVRVFTLQSAYLRLQES